MLCFSRQCGDQIGGSFLFCNIPRDFRRSDDLAFRISDGRNRQRDPYQTAVLTLPYSFEVLDARTPSDARQYCSLFVLSVLRDDDCDRLTCGLLGSVAEYALRTFVPACDNAVEIFAYNCIVTRLYN